MVVNLNISENNYLILLFIIIFCLIGIVSTSSVNYFIDYSQYDENSNMPLLRNCTSSWDCDYYQLCNDFGVCECVPHYEINYGLGHCVPCPDLNYLCTSCCRSESLQCYNSRCTVCIDNGKDRCNSSTNEISVTASQIALAAALIMGVSALAMLLYRIFLKPRYLSHEGRNDRCSNDRQESISGTSITSIQVRILARLRDRPPRYETQHNYDNRTTEQRTNEQTEPPPIINRSNISIICNEAPPTYEGINNSTNDSPPAYSDMVTHSSTTNTSTTLEIGPTRAIINQNFINTDDTITITNTNSIINETDKIVDSKNDINKDKIVHM